MEQTSTSPDFQHFLEISVSYKSHFSFLCNALNVMGQDVTLLQANALKPTLDSRQSRRAFRSGHLF